MNDEDGRWKNDPLGVQDTIDLVSRLDIVSILCLAIN